MPVLGDDNDKDGRPLGSVADDNGASLSTHIGYARSDGVGNDDVTCEA